MTVTDYPDYTTPQAHANAISLTGAPPLVLKQVVDALIGQTLAANSTTTRPASGKFPINQPGYEVLINVASLSNPVPIVSVELQWYDSTFGGLVDDEHYYFLSGDVNGHLIHGRGPSKGDRLVVVIRNHSATAQATFSYTMLQTSRTFTREFWKTTFTGTSIPLFPGFGAADNDIPGNIVCNDARSVPHNSTVTVELPLYTGTVRLLGITSDTVAGNSRWVILTNTDQIAVNIDTFEGMNGQQGFSTFGVTSLYVAELALPRSQCNLQLINTNATVDQTFTTSIVAQEDRA